MNVNKKLDRFKQWAGERMGGEVKTNLSDDFKALEIEMGLRHEGMERLQKSMNLYMKAVSKRTEVEGKEKTLPIAYLGGTMIVHGDDFDPSSEFGQCLNVFGRTQERLARAQETYISDATASWLVSLERSLVQMKEYQASRKKLETRRLAYDTSLAKMQKAKREDFRVEEELRSQQAKYEETEDDVFRRMQEVKEAESESVADLGAFLDAELAYHDKCRDALLQLRNEWPARNHPQAQSNRYNPRSRSNTAKSFGDRFDAVEEQPPMPEARPMIKSHRAVSNRAAESPAREVRDPLQTRPGISRTTTFEGPTQIRRDSSPVSIPRMSRLPSDSLTIRTTRSQLRNVDGVDQDIFQDDSNFDSNSSPDHIYGRSVSPATSLGSGQATPMSATGRKGPPPPPPSRAKKPPPPPPPAKRTLIT